MDVIQAFFNDISGQLALAVLTLAFLDFVLGVAAAVRDSTFAFASVAVFVQSHLVGRVFPIWLLLFVGYLTQGVEVAGMPLILGAGVAAGAAYVAETIASINASWGPNHGTQPQPPA